MTDTGRPARSRHRRTRAARADPDPREARHRPRHPQPHRPVRLGGRWWSSDRGGGPGHLRPDPIATEQEDVAHPARDRPGVLSALASVPRATFDAVGGTPPPSVAMVPPTVVRDQPPLTADGKPEVLYVGSDFCPFCAAERWPLVVALSRFGHFGLLHNTQSAPASVFPSIQTFTFTGTSYSSRYLTLTGRRALLRTAPMPTGSFTRIAALHRSAACPDRPVPERRLDRSRYRAPTRSWTSGTRRSPPRRPSAPACSCTCPRPPSSGDLAAAQGPAGQAIVAAANQLSAGICLATGQQPVRVCASKGCDRPRCPSAPAETATAGRAGARRPIGARRLPSIAPPDAGRRPWRRQPARRSDICLRSISFRPPQIPCGSWIRMA